MDGIRSKRTVEGRPSETVSQPVYAVEKIWMAEETPDEGLRTRDTEEDESQDHQKQPGARHARQGQEEPQPHQDDPQYPLSDARSDPVRGSFHGQDEKVARKPHEDD